MSVQTGYAVERGDYSDRVTLVLFTERLLAENYIGFVAAAQDAAERLAWGEVDSSASGLYEIVEYQLWHALPVIPPQLDYYSSKAEMPGVRK